MSVASDVASVVVWPGLAAVIAYALLSISTMNLANNLGSSLYERRPAGGGKKERDRKPGQNDLEFVYDSNEAQDLRSALAKFPRRLWPTYVLFLIAELLYALWVLFFRDSSSHKGGSDENMWGWYGGLPLLAVVFTAYLVIWTAGLNSKYYSVLGAVQQKGSEDA